MNLNIVQQLKSSLSKNEKTAYWYSQTKFLVAVTIENLFNWERLRLFWKIAPYTMVSAKRILNVYLLSEEIEQKKIEGVFAECGVWRGGCSAIMAYVAKKFGSQRKIWLFDSFEGLPEPTVEDGAIAKEYASQKIDGNLKTIGRNVAPLAYVHKLFFTILGIDKNDVVVKQGWFQNTLPVEKDTIGQIALLRLDGDWYESTKVCLENLYDKVVKGGYIIIDDYGHWEGCRKAVDEFFKNRNITVKMNAVDETGVYFQKP